MPILCSTFYSQMMLTSVPNGKKLEIKKTTVKKLSPYLNQKMTEGVLKIEKAAKGVEKIASVDFKVIDILYRAPWTDYRPSNSEFSITSFVVLLLK